MASSSLFSLIVSVLIILYAPFSSGLIVILGLITKSWIPILFFLGANISVWAWIVSKRNRSAPAYEQVPMEEALEDYLSLPSISQNQNSKKNHAQE